MRPNSAGVLAQQPRADGVKRRGGARRARRCSPSRSASRSRSSPAARTLNVTARISRAAACPVASRCATRCVSVRVLPVPGPGDDQQRPGAVADGLRLLGRQAGEQCVGRGRAGAGAGRPAAGWVMRHLPVMGRGERQPARRGAGARVGVARRPRRLRADRRRAPAAGERSSGQPPAPPAVNARALRRASPRRAPGARRATGRARACRSDYWSG